MKTTTRGKLLMALCAAAVAALACLPLAWFAWQDSRLFGTVDTASAPYDHRAVTGEDFYLLNQVKARAQAIQDSYRSVSFQDENAPYSSAGNRRNTMKQDTNICNYAASLLRSLNEAGALPDAWYDEAVSGMTSYDPRLYTSSDSLGITRLILFPHASDETSDNYYYEAPRFALDFDPKTGKVLALWMQVPISGDEASDRAEALTAPLDTQAVLDAWVEWEGLSALGDWAMPARGQYAETGTYSPSGEALLTCVNDTYREDSTDRAYFSMQLNWQARDPSFAPYDGADLVPQGDAEQLSAGSDTAMYTVQIAPKQAADGSYVFCRYSAESTPYIILRTDLTTGEQRPFCDVPGCDHMSDSCPARFSIDSRTTPTVAVQGSKAYLFLCTFASFDVQQDTLAKMSDEEVMRWYYALNEGVPAALYTKELPDYTADDAAGIRRNLGGGSSTQVWVLDGSSRRLLADFEDAYIDFQWADDDHLYGTRSAADPAEYDQWVRLDKTNGGYGTMPIPDAEQVLGVCGGKLILSDCWHKEPNTEGNVIETALTAGHNYTAYSDSSKQLLLSYDPETGELRQLFCQPGYAMSVSAVYGGNVYLNYTEIDGTEHHSVRLNVESGAMTLAEELFHVPLEGAYAGYYLGGSLSGFSHAANNWISWSSGDPDNTLLMDLDTGYITDPPVRSDLDAANNSYLILADASDDRLLLGWYENWYISGYETSLGSPWYSELRQYLAPIDDLSDLTPVKMWEPGEG